MKEINETEKKRDKRVENGKKNKNKKSIVGRMDSRKQKKEYQDGDGMRNDTYRNQ